MFTRWELVLSFATSPELHSQAETPSVATGPIKASKACARACVCVCARAHTHATTLSSLKLNKKRRKKERKKASPLATVNSTMEHSI